MIVNKIGIIGCGKVGLTIVHELLVLNSDLKLLLIDENQKKLLSNIDDLNQRLSNVQIKIGNYNDLDDCSIIILTIGIQEEKNRTRFLKNSYQMISNVMDKIKKSAFQGKIIVVSNPNDVITTYVAKHYDNNKVIGTGTTLDTKRLKYFLGEKLNILPKKIDAVIVGEHGREQTILWNCCQYQGLHIDINDNDKKELAEKVINAASLIVQGKGYTNYGIASCVVEIILKILENKPFSLVASFYDLKNDISYSQPIKYTDNKIFINDDYPMPKMAKCLTKIKREYKIFEQETIIGIDLDDTITDIQEEMKKKARIFDLENHGNGIVDVNKYLVGEMYNWNNEMKDQFFRTYRREIVNNAKIRKNVVKVFRNWQKLGYKIIIITARNKKYYDDPYLDTYKWLKKHHLPFDELIIGSNNKKEICEKYKINYFVDDMPINCLEVNKIKDVKVFIMDNGNNICDDKDIIRINNFEEMSEVIKNG